MAALNFTEIPPAQSGSDRDQFELFAGEFLTQEGFEVIEGPDRGPDLGRDLIVQEVRTGPGGDTVVRWLVSCKHKAHSGNSVRPGDEMSIRDRIEKHNCTGFIAFYSTVPTSSLAANLNSLRPKFGLIVYDPAHIERKLLDSPGFRTLAARYVPVSFNAWVQNSQYAMAEPGPDPQMARNKYFLRKPHQRLEQGLKEAKLRRLLAFVVIYDPKHPTHSQLDYALGYFMEYQTTKRLVDQHFVAIVGPSSDPQLSRLVPEDDPLELALWVVMDSDGQIIRRESVYANPDEGMRRVREVIAAILRGAQSGRDGK
jgi:hypothetical protein